MKPLLPISALKFSLVTQQISLEAFDAYSQLLLNAIAGGVTAVQLRIKELQQATILAQHFKQLLTPFNIPLIINDHVYLAAEINAAGVHLGQKDMPPAEARQILGDEKIIGLSVENVEQLEIANTLSTIDYVAASAIFPSQNKPDCKTIWGIEGLKNFTQRSLHPVIAIGGIHEHNVQLIMSAGAYGIAVIGAIHDAPDPKKTAQIMWSKIHVSSDQHAITEN